MSTLTDLLDKLPLVRRKKVEVWSEERIAEELSLRDLHKLEGNVPNMEGVKRCAKCSATTGPSAHRS